MSFAEEEDFNLLEIRQIDDILKFVQLHADKEHVKAWVCELVVEYSKLRAALAGVTRETLRDMGVEA